MSQSKWVQVGSVRRFDEVKPDKRTALRLHDATGAAYEAWMAYDMTLGIDGYLDAFRRKKLLDECADVIQATFNLVAALGVEDFRPWMKACEERNRKRGRITK